MANKVQPKNKVEFLPVEEDLNWCLDKLVNGWMRVIGIEPNIPVKKDWRWILWFLQRFFPLGSMSSINLNLFTPVGRIKKKLAKNPFKLLFGTSGWILSRHRSRQFSAQLLLLLVISPNWNELRTVMNRAEYHLLNYPRVYPQIRKILPFVFAPLVPWLVF